MSRADEASELFLDEAEARTSVESRRGVANDANGKRSAYGNGATRCRIETDAVVITVVRLSAMRVNVASR